MRNLRGTPAVLSTIELVLVFAVLAGLPAAGVELVHEGRPLGRESIKEARAVLPVG